MIYAENKLSTFADRALAGHYQIDRLGTFAFFIRFDVKADALALDQRLQPCALHGGDVNKNIAPPVVRFDEPVAALTG